MTRSGPVRTCVGCGRREAQSALLRIQLDEAGAPALVRRPRAGRSAYVHADASCAAALLRSKGMARSLRTAASGEERARLRSMVEERIGCAPGAGIAGPGRARVELNAASRPGEERPARGE